MKDSDSKKRLSKVLAAAGVASRRTCETIIFDGRVKVNGAIALLPQTPVDIEKDKITVDGKAINHVEEKVYYILNKPAGYICTNRRFDNTKVVLDLFEGVKSRLFTVGRLDKNTQGLIIVTNDGHFANEVIHPSSEINKEYVAKTDHEITHEHLKAISSGTLVQGSFIKPLEIKKVRRNTLKVSIAEGKKHEVRLLLEAAGLKVQELKRIRIGGLHLGLLETGAWRAMTKRERELVFE